MDEAQLVQAYQRLESGIKECVQHIKILEEELSTYKQTADEKISNLETTLFDEIINPANEYIEETNRNARFDDFNEKYGEKLGAFSEPLKAIEGDDFDIVREAFDKYDEYDGEDKADEDTYVDVIVEGLEKQIDTIKEKLGIPADEPVTIEENGEGDVQVSTEDGEVVAESNEDGELEPTEGELPEEGEVIEGEEEDDPEEVAAFEEELKNYK